MIITQVIHCSGLWLYRIAIIKICSEPDNGYQVNYLAGTETRYLNTCCIANFLVLYVVQISINKKSIIPRVCCFQLCVLTHCIGLRLIYVKYLVYMTHSLQEYKPLVL